MSDIARTSEKLREVLGAEEELYLSMQKLLCRERESLLELEVEAIEDCVSEKEVLAEEGRLLEQTRVAICAELGEALDLGCESPTLAALTRALGSAAGELADQHSRLLALVAAVRELTEVNDRFAGGSLERVQRTLRLLGGLLPEGPIYGPGGETERRAGDSRLFDRVA